MLRDFTLFEFVSYLFAANLTRYFIVSGLFYLFFYVLFRKKWTFKKIQTSFPKPTDYQREIGYSILTLSIFVFMAWLVFYSPLREHTLFYNQINERSMTYWGLSVFAIILIHDTYFYWTHRAMHHPLVYRAFHRTHHLSRNPSPWAAFAFHPLEAFVEAGIIFIIAFTLPVHPSALLTFLLFMTVYNAYGHLGYELYPKNFNLSVLGKWINTSIAHNQHHEKFVGNYGLYFLFWDRWMGTLRKDYDNAFKESTTKRRNNPTKSLK